MNILDWLENPSTRAGVHLASDDPAAGWAFVPYAELAEDVLRTAGLLVRHGIARNDVVCILLGEPRDFLPAFYGTLAAGGTPSPLAPPLTFRSRETYTKHLEGVLMTATPAFILVEPRVLSAVEEAVAATCISSRIVPFDTARFRTEDIGTRQKAGEHVLLQFTSGSSGSPKGIQVAADNLDSNTHAMQQQLDLRPDDVLVSWLPHYHDMGLIGSLLTPIQSGVDIRLLKPAHFVRSPLRWLQCLGRDGGTTTLSPSFGFSYAARRLKPADLDGLDFSNWRVAFVAAERTDVVGVGDFVSLAQPHGFSPKTLMVAYGLAEATLAVSGTRTQEPVPILLLAQTTPHEDHGVEVVQQANLGDSGLPDGNWVTACGGAVAQTEIDIVDEQGLSLPNGHLGQIQVRGASVTRGYKGSPHALTSTFFDGGTLSTGDTGFVLDGQLYVVGRTGDSIKVRGLKLFAEDIDIKIRQACGIAPGRCVALLGMITGADVVAVIVESEDDSWVSPASSTISASVSEDIVIALFRAPKGTIERTSSGKPRRQILWRRLLNDDLPVELMHTNWGAVSAHPAPWQRQQTVDKISQPAIRPLDRKHP